MAANEVDSVLTAQSVDGSGSGRASLIDDLLDVTSGWPAAVAVAAARLRDDPTWSPSQRSAGVRLLAGLLGGLVEATPSVPALALLPLIDAETAALVSGPDALTALRVSGLPHRINGPWLIIPDSIRDGLRSLVGPAATVDRSAAVRVAGRYAALGELATAVTFLREVGQADAAVHLLAQQHWTDLEALGLSQVEQVLATADDTDPITAALLLRGIWATEANQPSLRTTFLDRLTLLDDLPPPMQRAVDAERARSLARAMRPAEAAELAAHVVATADRTEMITHARALLASGQAYAVHGTGDGHETARDHLEQSAALFASVNENRWRAEALARLGYSVLFHQCRLHAAAAAMETALSLLPSGDRTRAHWLSSYADVLDTVGREMEAVSATVEAVEIGERLQDSAITGLGVWTRGWIAGRRGDLDTLRGALREVESLRPGWLNGYQGIEFYGSFCDFFVSLGDTESARACERKARALHETYPYAEAIDMMSARIESIIGDPAVAIAMFDRLDDSIGAQPSTRWVRRLEAAVACRRLGDHARSQALIADAFAITHEMGVADLPYRFEGRLLEMLDIGAGEAGTAAEAGPTDRYTVTMLGGFAVRRGNTDVTPPAGHPSTLVKLLVLRKHLTVDAVIDQLWPEADVDTGRARLRNTMNRLRTRSGAIVERRDDSIVLADGVVSDVDTFERAAAEALAAPDAQRIGSARQAIALHAGQLLPGDMFDDWAAGPRERLMRRYLALLDLVAAAAEADGALDEAARLLDMAIAADPLDEQRYVHLGRLLRRQGRRSAARQVAERGVAMLAELGVEASSDLVELPT
jgi:DNA-binding SARP family transcriptional activator